MPQTFELGIHFSLCCLLPLLGSQLDGCNAFICLFFASKAARTVELVATNSMLLDQQLQLGDAVLALDVLSGTLGLQRKTLAEALRNTVSLARH